MTNANINPAEGPVIFSREFDAPVELVWQAWAEPDRMVQWWGPKGFTMKVATVDFRPGGIFHYAMSAPGSEAEMWGKITYREIDPHSRLSFVTSFSDPQGAITRHPMSDTWPLEVLSTLTFEARGSKTLLTGQALAVNPSSDEQATFDGGMASMQAGNKGMLDQLEEFLAGAA